MGAAVMPAFPPAAAEIPVDEPPACIDTNLIEGYSVIDDTSVRFFVKGQNPVVATLQKQCHDLKFHGYIAYTPGVGGLCARRDTIRTRSGLPCLIERFTVETAEGPATTEKPE